MHRSGRSLVWQDVWLFSRTHDEQLGKDNAGLWVPDEDLEDV